jgi:hypothetical protein
MKIQKIILLCVFFTIGLVTRDASAQAGSVNDFDADGESDIYQIDNVSKSNVRWYVRGSASQTISDEGIFGKKNNITFPMDWTGVPSITRVSPVGSKLNWSARRVDDNSSIGNFDLGGLSQTVVVGGDFDGSLLPDAVTVRKKGANFKWTIKYDPLAEASPGVEEDIIFGPNTGKPSYLNLDGDGDWLVVSAKSPLEDSYLIRAKNPRTGEVREISIGSESILPQPLADPAGKDVMIFVTETSIKTTVKFFGQDGLVFRDALSVNTPGPADGQVIVGDFDSADPGEEVGVKTGTSLIVYNPFSDNISSVADIDYTPVDSFFVGSLSGDICGALKLPDGPFGSLWKPNSDTMYFAVYVASSKYTGKTASVALYAANTGKKIKNLTYKGAGNPDPNGIVRENWQDYSSTGSMYKNEYGAIKLRMNLKDGSCVSATLNDPSIRVD